MTQQSNRHRPPKTGTAVTLGLVLGAAAGLAAAGYYWLLKRPLPRMKGDISLPAPAGAAGLQAPVEIRRDRWGVPHIYAENNHDLSFAQGFVHAQDRLWQMEFQRRLVAGRLSEVIGRPTIPIDRWLRTLGMRRAAERDLALLNPAVRAELAAYAAGVNARIAQGRLPVEFTILRYQPEPWTAVDSTAWIKMMAWTLSVNWEGELLRAQLIDRLGLERAAELEPDYFDRWPIIVPPGVDYSAIGDSALKKAADGRPFMSPPADAGLGSNNWTLAGSRTASGAPIFANDMHLPLNAPAIWYENHLSGGDLHVTGITLPGIPGIVSGHNGRVAWGITNGFDDVQDLYMEHLRHTEDGRVQYEFKGEWLDAEIVREEIKVKGGETEIEEVIITRHGPIINALIESEDSKIKEQPLALRWTSLEADTTANTLYNILRANDCHELHEALRPWVGPTSNFVHADTAGNIAYSHPGKIPIRAKGSGAIPVPGWTGEYEWTGFIPFEELPHVVNPPEGYIVTANNRVVDEDYPYFLSSDDLVGADRAQRINELIAGQPLINIDYIQQMQFDLVSPVARVVKTYLADLDVGDDPDLVLVTALMRDWDGQLTSDSPAAAVQQIFMRRMIFLSLADKLGDLTIRYAGKGPAPGLVEGSIFGHRSWMWLEKTLAEPNSHWFDLGNGESRDDVMRLALRETVDYLQAELGPEISDWSWGKLHKLTFAHPLGQVKPLDKLFNRGPFPFGGDPTTIWNGMANFHDLDCPTIIGPPFRFIANLKDLRRSWGLLAPGQSGQPRSKHYDDQIEAWFNGGYHPMYYAREDVERETASILHLRPG